MRARRNFTLPDTLEFLCNLVGSAELTDFQVSFSNGEVSDAHVAKGVQQVTLPP